VRISDSNAGYTVFRGSVKGTGYPLHSPVPPLTSPPVRHRVPSHFSWSLTQILRWLRYGFEVCLVNSLALRLTGRQAVVFGKFMVSSRSWSRGSSICIVTGLRSGRPSGRDSIPGRGKMYTPKRPRGLWCSPGFLSGSFIGG